MPVVLQDYVRPGGPGQWLFIVVWIAALVRVPWCRRGVGSAQGVQFAAPRHCMCPGFFPVLALPACLAPIPALSLHPPCRASCTCPVLSWHQVILIGLMCSTKLRRTHPWNLVALAAFTLVESALVGMICSYWDASVSPGEGRGRGGKAQTMLFLVVWSWQTPCRGSRRAGRGRQSARACLQQGERARLFASRVSRPAGRASPSL